MCDDNGAKASKKRGDKFLGTPQDGNMVRVIKGVHKNRVGKVINETAHTFLVKWINERDEKDRPVTKYKSSVVLEQPLGTRKITYYFGINKEESDSQELHNNANKKVASLSVIVEV